MFVLRFSFYFALSFTLLSLPISDKPLFSHMHNFTAPYTSKVFATATDYLKDGVDKVKQVFVNSKPDWKPEDMVISNPGSSKNKKDFKFEDDNYTVEEKEILKKVLKKAQY